MIIGLTGPMASGKSTVVDALKKDGFKHTTLSDLVREETERRGLPAERTTFQNVAQSMREKHGAGVLGKKAREKILEEGGDRWVVDGIRNPAEITELKKLPNFVLIANTAPEDLIVSRILSRKRPDDTLDEASIRTKLRREMGEGEPPEGQQVQKCIDVSDYVFENTMPMDQVETQFMKLYHSIRNQ
jgi:dephospho-CoA kinase